MAASKAAKTGGRKVVAPRQWFCDKGHVMFRYLLVPIKGARKLLWGCECVIEPMRTK